jgi:hypothetical protein
MRAVKPAPSPATRAQVRHYVVVTYCGRFAREGWVYDDGALSVAAQRWSVNGARCATSRPRGKTRTVPCEQLDAGQEPRIIDCAMLRFVRRAEVRKYIRELQRQGKVRCDDGTPLGALGVP